MAYTADDLTTIERAIASGQSSVRFADGRELTHAPMDALLRARSEIRIDLAGQASGTPVTRRIRIYTSKDF